MTSHQRDSIKLLIVLFSYTSASNSNFLSHPPFLFTICLPSNEEEVRNSINDFISHSSLQNMTRTVTKILFFLVTADYMWRRHERDLFCLSSSETLLSPEQQRQGRY